MSSSLAQDELDRYFSSKDNARSHPEDRADSNSDDSYPEEEKEPTYVNDDAEGSDEEPLHDQARGRMSYTATQTYTLPTTLFDANTGPKGVIADAASFERAKKKSFRRTLYNFTANAYPFSKTPSQKDTSSPERSANEADDEEEFMRKWRENRLKELQNGIGTQRKASPSKRRWGGIDDVDANGYLDAVEKPSSDAIVVVCIYDPESAVSTHVEESLETIARRHMTTRFIKLHHEIAEMNHVGAPAILAYKGGDVFATIVNIVPEQRDVDALEALLLQHRIV